MKHSTSLVKSLPALLTLTGGFCLGTGNAGASVQQPLDSRIEKISRDLATQSGSLTGDVTPATGGVTQMCVTWPNWHNGGWRNWHNWHNWHNW